MSIAAITVVLTGAVLAFGAVYEWAFGPLALAVVAIALWQWRPRAASGALVWTAALVLAAVGIQLIPLAASLLGATSPAAPRFLNAFSVAFANGLESSHPLSIDPARTVRGLGFLLLGMLWVPSCAAALGKPAAARTLARNVVILGTAVAVIGLAQKATFNGKLLWFWTPQFFADNGFGPFVNRNHFAGWMLLSLMVSVGLLFAHMTRSAPPTGATWRERLLWIGSPAASPALLTAAASVVMACALVWTMSRSGIAAAGAGLALLLSAAIYRSKRSMQRWLLAGYLLFTVMGVVAWRGADTLVNWYGNTETLQWRLQLWADTLPAVEDYWLTGSGLNTFGTLMMVQPRTDLRVQPREAHNDYLQLAVEGGVLVCVPALLLAMALGREILRALRSRQDETTWWIRMGAVAGILGMAVQEISEFSLQIPAVALLFGTCLATAIHEAAPLPVRRSSRSPRESIQSPVNAAA